MTVHLQGIGSHPAIYAKNCKPGMVRVYNYGATAEILSVEPVKGGKSVKITAKESNGKIYETVKRNTTLIAIA